MLAAWNKPCKISKHSVTSKLKHDLSLSTHNLHSNRDQWSAKKQWFLFAFLDFQKRNLFSIVSKERNRFSTSKIKEKKRKMVSLPTPDRDQSFEEYLYWISGDCSPVLFNLRQTAFRGHCKLELVCFRCNVPRNRHVLCLLGLTQWISNVQTQVHYFVCELKSSR